MKKLFILMVSILVLSFSTVSAGAYASPVLEGNTDTDGETSSTSSIDSTSSTNSTSSTSSGNTTNTTSPKTGETTVYALLAVAAAAVFGGVAIGAKKKTED